MRDPFVAVDTSTDLRSYARRLRRSWERSRGGDEPAAGVRPLIEASWERTRRAGIDPDRPDPMRAFDRDALADQRAASGLTDCIDALRTCLGGFAHDAEHVMVVADAQCRILWMEGHPAVRRSADRIIFEEGMLWTEDSVGTNAIGTALAIDHAVQVFSAEHFAAGQHPWWCSAAPIHDANGELVGVVDLSGPMRTAHPHSLALVATAAGMAEELLRARSMLADERLRRIYVERTIGTGRHAHALVTADGRVLAADNAAVVSSRLAIPAGGGAVALPDGTTAVAEPLESGRGFVLWADAGAGTAAPTRVRLELLGDAPQVRIGRSAPVALGLRHAEILCLLTLHPEGLGTETLTGGLYGDAGKRVSVRAEVSRLRRLLPGLISARPYRLNAALSSDLADIEHAMRHDDADAAVAAYHAPLLPGSTAPMIQGARAELEAVLRRTAVAGPPGRLWTWLQTRTGRDDADALAQFVRRAGARDPRRAVAAGRLRALQGA